MSVITNKETNRYCYGNRPTAMPCAVCQQPVQYPFLHWDTFNICGRCCQRIKRGFIADLIDVVAIMDLRDSGYPYETFSREQIVTVERRERGRKTMKQITLSVLNRNNLMETNYGYGEREAPRQGPGRARLMKNKLNLPQSPRDGKPCPLRWSHSPLCRIGWCGVQNGISRVSPPRCRTSRRTQSVRQLIISPPVGLAMTPPLPLRQASTGLASF